MTSNLTKPIVTAKKQAYERLIHGEKLVDEYHWLREVKWPAPPTKEILNYLNAENEHTESFFKPIQNKIDGIYKEIIGRIKLQDQSVPIRHRNYYYSTITKEKSNYATHVRRRSLESQDEIIFDGDKEAQGHKYFSVGGLSISPNERLLAYSLDIKGDEYYTIRVRDLDSGKELPDSITRSNGTAVWDEEGRGFFYVKMDDKWRATEAYYHSLGTSQDQDELIYKETDDTFHISLSKTSDYKYIILSVSSSTSAEVRYLPSIGQNHQALVLIARRPNHLCEVDHMHDSFYIQTNDKGKNFRLVRVADSNPVPEHYEELIPHSDSQYLIDVDLYDHYLIVETRNEGLPQISIMDHELRHYDSIKFKDAAYTASAIFSCHDDDEMLISYSSLVSPNTIFRYKFKDKQMLKVKVQEIPSGYDESHYQCERVFAQSRDGKTKVPISLVYKKSLFKKNGSNPLFLYGYGAYGIPIHPAFSVSRLSLLDRGFVFAIAHVRGGDELGFKWYEEAKFLNKRITFYDFIDCAQFLSEEHYTHAGNIAIQGGSAGGTLVAVAVNEEPTLFKAVVANVPFVDILNTMLDDTLPLTPGEFKEWGNPMSKDFFDYIKSYSPYNNVKPQAYPAMYVTASINDPRVPYWEPAKWVAKLRATKTDSNVLLFETQMETGHRGSTGRFERFKEVAQEYAFVLRIFGKL
jgi:oligopeptidase B